MFAMIGLVRQLVTCWLINVSPSFRAHFGRWWWSCPL